MKEQTVSRIGMLEGLRGYLALWVMVAHVGYFVGLSRFEGEKMFSGLPAFALSYFDLSGYDAVKLFMILSGFVIFYLLDQGKESYLGFIVRRFFRLWPLFIVAVFFGLIINNIYIDDLQNNPWSHNFWIHRQLVITQVVQSNPIPYLFVNFFLLNGQTPKFILENAASAFSPIGWCISTEWFFYLLAPLFFKATKKALGTGVLAGLVLVAVACENYYGFWINPVHSFLPMQIHWFFTGLVSYLIYRDIRAKGFNRQNLIKLGLLFFFIVVVTAMHPREGLGLWLWLVIFGTLLISISGRTNFVSTLILRILDNPISRYFGRISYPVYLLHWPIIILAVKGLRMVYPQSSWAVAELILLVAVTAITLPLSHLTHYCLEAPAMDFGKRVASRFPPRRGPSEVISPLGKATERIPLGAAPSSSRE